MSSDKSRTAGWLVALSMLAVAPAYGQGTLNWDAGLHTHYRWSGFHFTTDSAAQQELWPAYTSVKGPALADEAAQEGNGISVEIAYTVDAYANFRGGIRRGTAVLDNFDLALTLDAERILGWSGATFFFYGLGNQGESPTEKLIGDLQTVSNIDAPSTWKLYEAWLDQSLANGKASLRFGLYDLNSEFDAIESAGLFSNSSHGIGPDYSQTGENGPSIFPTTSLAFRVLVQPVDALYVQAVALDGSSGKADNPFGTHIVLEKDDGLLIAGEVAYVNGGGKVALGGYTYTAEFESVRDVDGSGNPLMTSGNRGLYVLMDQMIFRERSNPDQGLAVFARAGFANHKVNQLSGYRGGGLVYTGLFAGRDEDQLGLAVAVAMNGNDFKTAQLDAGQPVDGSEINVELTYSAQVTPMFSVKPDLQYVINPGTDPSLRNALALGVRLGVVF